MSTGATVRRLFLAVGCIAGLACASAGAAASREVPPRPLPDSPPLALRFTATAVTTSPSAGTARSAIRPPNIRLNIEVEVDEQGRADVGTLKVLGTGSVEHRPAILEWLREARFEPAKRDGVAVRGIYKLTIDPSRNGGSVR